MQSAITPDPERRSFIEEARRKQIVAAAIESLAEFGFARTSLAAIAKRANISKGVISYHFAGKRELIEQVIAQVYTDQSSFLNRMQEVEGGAAARLNFYIQGSFDFMKQNPQLLRALMEIFLNFRKPDGSTFYNASAAELTLAALEALLKDGQQRGEFGQFSPRVMALSLRAVIQILPMQLDLLPDIELDAHAAEVIALFDRATRRQRPLDTYEEEQETE